MHTIDRVGRKGYTCVRESGCGRHDHKARDSPVVGHKYCGGWSWVVRRLAIGSAVVEHG